MWLQQFHPGSKICRSLFIYEKKMLKILLLALLWNGFCLGYLDRYSDTVCQELTFNMSQTCSLAALFNYRSIPKFVLSSLENSFLKIAEKSSGRFNDFVKRCSFRLGDLASSDPTETSVLRAENISLNFFCRFQKISLMFDTVSDYPNDKQVLIYFPPETNCFE